MLTADNVVVDERFATTHFRASLGRFVAVGVHDSGTGISPANIDKIFEPFFTTKELGKGTGLGLSNVLAIVKGHEGFVDVTSSAEEGTTFTVFLPATTEG